MAMALGLGFSAPHPLERPCPSLSSLAYGSRRRKQLFLARAVKKDDVEITSVQDQEFSTLAQRLLKWGQQATQQVQKLFNELADGSFLFTFGPPGSDPPNAVAKKITLPPRLPSRFTKQFPYGAKRRERQMVSEVADGFTDNSQAVKKLPSRAPSTFLKKSPITTLSKKHVARAKTLEKETPQLVPDYLTATQDGSPTKILKDICDDAGQPEGVGKSRPKTIFTRKSPIPEGGKSTARKRIRSTQRHGGTSVDDVKESSRSSGANKDVGEQSLIQADLTQDFERTKIEAKRSRPVTAFSRKSPITSSRGEKGRRKDRKAASSEEVIMQSDKDKASGVQPKPKVRPRTTFSRKSPITNRKDSRRRRSLRVGMTLEHETISTFAVENAVMETSAEPQREVSMKTARLHEVVHAKAVSPVKAVESAQIEAEQASVLIKADTLAVEEDGSATTDLEVSDDESLSSGSISETELSLLTLQKLKKIARARGLKGYSKLRKAELIELLKQS